MRRLLSVLTWMEYRGRYAAQKKKIKNVIPHDYRRVFSFLHQ